MGLLTSSVCPLLNAQVPKENYNIYINQVVLAVLLLYCTIKVTPHKELCFFISTLCMFGFVRFCVFVLVVLLFIFLLNIFLCQQVWSKWGAVQRMKTSTLFLPNPVSHRFLHSTVRP